MALTDIARQLKRTFEGFETSGHQEQLNEFRAQYRDAEAIRIGETDYIVINDEYHNDEYNDLPENMSPLFCDMSKPGFAIIDAKTSSTLIDEVYSRVTYMRRTCRTDIAPSESDVEKSVRALIGDDTEFERVVIPDDDGVVGKANIFQCQLIKDTGVSAAPDSFSFMIKNGEIKEIDEAVMRQVKHSGTVSFLRDSADVKSNNAQIQKAVFDKYDRDSDIDIQSISVRSIFEIAMAFRNVQIWVKSEKSGKPAIYHTTHLPSEKDEFEVLNENIHVCNCCGQDLINVENGSKHKLHVNTDALQAPRADQNAELIYAVGCEDCLEQCPVCGEWHFNYEKNIGKNAYDKIIFAPGRAFVKGLRSIDANYCACRENIEWVHDEKQGDKFASEHDIIPINKMAFVNYTDECVSSYPEWQRFYNQERQRKKNLVGLDEAAFAKKMLGKFKKRLAERLKIDVNDIKITSIDRCHTCGICGGNYYCATASAADENYRCPICDEMISENKHMLTRIDGMVFMRKKSHGRDVISKYILTKLGNLKRVSTNAVRFGTEDEKSDALADASTVDGID